MSAESYLLLVIAVLVIALAIAIAYGRIDAQAATEAAEDLAADYRSDLTRLSADNAHLRELNGELRDALAPEPSLTEAVYATLADLPITSPDDDR